MASFKHDASVYLENRHPLIPFDRTCTGCAAQCGKAVPAAGPDDFTKIKLIVMTDYPGKFDLEQGWPQVPNSLVLTKKDRAKKIPPGPNSGQFIRDLLTEMFGLCTFSEVWFTNAIKCDPNFENRHLVVTDRIIRSCNKQWGFTEFALLDRFVPNVPILVAGSKALKALQLMYGAECPSGSLNSYLRRTDLKIANHPMICCYPPAAYAKSVGNIETQIGISKDNLVEITGVRSLAEFFFLPVMHYKTDISGIQAFLS